MYLRETIEKTCGKCKKKYKEHKDFDDHGIKLCNKCFAEFFDEQRALKRNKISISKQKELEKLTRYWKGRNSLGDDKRLEIAKSNLLHLKKELKKNV